MSNFADIIVFSAFPIAHTIYSYHKRNLVSRSLQNQLDSWVNGKTLPNAQLAVFKGKKEIFFGSAGTICEKGPQIDRNTIFRIYSMTKPITIVAALILVDRGLISLNDPLSKYIPEFLNIEVVVGGDAKNPITEKCERELTIEDLMKHTSGITYAIFGNNISDQIMREKLGDGIDCWYKNKTLPELCTAVAATPLAFQPGTKWLYGFNQDILGRVIEIVSNKSLDSFFKKEIFDPLGMDDTGFIVPFHKIFRLVECYEVNSIGNSYKVSGSPERDRSSPGLLAGGGGLVSTITDYSRFVQCLHMNGDYDCAMTNKPKKLLQGKTMERMRSNLIPDNGTLQSISLEGTFSETIGPGIGFGLGVSVLTDPNIVAGGQLSGQGEYSWGGVASTWFFVDPEKDVSAVFMTQVIPSSKVYVRQHIRYLSHWAATYY